MTPQDARFEFPRLLAKLLQFAADQQLLVQMGECYRTPEQAALNAARGTGVAKSLHCERLAVDLLCFRPLDAGTGKGGLGYEYLSDGTAPEYARLGRFWESLDAQCRWGGRFSKPDYDHFSLAIDQRG